MALRKTSNTSNPRCSPKPTPLGLVCPPTLGEAAPTAAPSSPASAGLTGLEPVRFFTGTVGTLRGVSRDHVRRHPHPHMGPGATPQLPEQLHRPWLETENPPMGQCAPPCPTTAFSLAL